MVPRLNLGPIAGPSRIRAVPKPKLTGRRGFGFDSYQSGGRGRGQGQDQVRDLDEARNPVVRDSLVPIVVEQTVSPSSAFQIFQVVPKALGHLSTPAQSGYEDLTTDSESQS